MNFFNKKLPFVLFHLYILFCPNSYQQCGYSSDACSSYNFEDCTCRICISRFYLNNGKCFSCSYNCVSCTSSTNCNSCESGYYLYNNKCYKCNHKNVTILARHVKIQVIIV